MFLTRKSFVRRSLAFAVLAGAAGIGCTDFSNTPDQLGHLIVTAKDETTGAAVSGIKFDAFLSDRSTIWARATTGANGSAEFREGDGGILPQTYIVKFDTTTPGYVLAPSEPTERPAIIVVSQTITVNFVVRKSGPGGNPGGS